MRWGVIVLALLACVANEARAQEAKPGKSSVTKKDYGKRKDGAMVEEYTLTNPKGMVVKIITLGGIISEWTAPDKAGKFANIALGCDSLADYEKGHPYFGCITGRVANRIARGKFTLDGKEYELAINNKPNHLHGGAKGFDKVVWKVAGSGVVRSLDGEEGAALVLTYRSVDGEEGYPGNLDCLVRYVLTHDNALRIEYEAKTDKATPINLTNHAYFNLAGHDAGDVLGHQLTLFASQITPTDKTLIPTGKLAPVKGTPYDFTAATAIGKRIGELEGDPGGYDVNYVIDRKGAKGPVLAARVREPKSGRVMEVLTTEPGIQLYTGNYLSKQKGRGGAVYGKHAGFCLETQHFPDSINQPSFPSVVLRPGKTYSSTTVYRFRAE